MYGTISSTYCEIESVELLAAIDVPVSVAVGAQSHPAICRANGLVAMSVKGATFKTIGGAAHFMISTHAAAVADRIERHVACADARTMEVFARSRPVSGEAASRL